MRRFFSSESRKSRKEENEARKRVPQSEFVVHGSRSTANGPAWLPKRERPITPPPNSTAFDDNGKFRTISQTSPFFAKLPLEIRRRIYDFALGDEMLRLEVDGQKLDLWHCNGWTKAFWADNGGWKKEYGFGWEFLNYPPEEHKKGYKRRHRRAVINLLCTCRQVYIEAIGSIYESQTFVLAIGEHKERVHQDNDKPALLYLPYFILPQRLNQLRRIYIHWNLSPATLHIGIADEITTWWVECWRFLASLQGLNELLIRFQCRDQEHCRWDWEPLQSQMETYIKQMKAKRRFVVVLPFPGPVGKIDVGESGCKVMVAEANTEQELEELRATHE